MHDSPIGSVWMPQHGAQHRTGTRDRKISPDPSSLQKLSPIPDHYHLYLGPNGLTVYSTSDWCKGGPHVKFKGVCGPFRWIIKWAPPLVLKISTRHNSFGPKVFCFFFLEFNYKS